MNLQTTATESHEQEILPSNIQIDLSFFVFYGIHAMNYFVSLGILICQGRRTQRLTKSLS